MNAIEMKNITMMFGSFKANDNVNLIVEKGEVHALIGENGAGKSTLMSILFGMYHQTAGTVAINGKIVDIKDPIEANALGIGMVHQHFKLVDTMSVLDNIILNNEDLVAKTFINRKNSRKKLQAVMDRYGFVLDMDKKVSKLTVAEQQRVEILKMLYRDSEILIFDEPTAVLTPQQIKDFLQAIKDLQAKGKTIIIISHKLQELKEVAQRGTVIRKGKYIGTFNMAEKTIPQIAEMMVGSSVNMIVTGHSTVDAQPIVKVRNLTMHKASTKNVIGLENLSLDLKPGEILAIAGVEGNGQTELINALSGLQKVEKGTIEILVDKKIKEKGQEDRFEKTFIESSKLSIKKRYKMGMSHIPEDRHKHGVVLDMNIIENTIIQDNYVKPFSKFGILNFKATEKHAENIQKQFDVRSGFGLKSSLRSMSGGNQQKFIVGRELSRASASFVIVAQPTRGLDISAIQNIHKFILKAKEDGKAVLLISYELEEVLTLADRVLVLNAGKAVDTVNNVGLTKDQLGIMMTGRKIDGLNEVKSSSFKAHTPAVKVEVKLEIKKAAIKKTTKKTKIDKSASLKKQFVKKEAVKQTTPRTLSAKASVQEKDNYGLTFEEHHNHSKPVVKKAAEENKKKGSK